MNFLPTNNMVIYIEKRISENFSSDSIIDEFKI